MGRGPLRNSQKQQLPFRIDSDCCPCIGDSLAARPHLTVAEPYALPSDTPLRLPQLFTCRRLGWSQVRVEIIIEPQEICVFPQMAYDVVRNNGFHSVCETAR